MARGGRGLLPKAGRSLRYLSEDEPLNGLAQILFDNRLMRTQQQISTFLEALEIIELARDASIIADLLLVFDDDCAHVAPMQSLSSYIETFPIEIWLPVLISMTSEMTEKAQDWNHDFYAHILNSDDTRAYLKQLYDKLPKSDRPIIRKSLLSLSENKYLDEELKITLRLRAQEVLEIQ